MISFSPIIALSVSRFYLTWLLVAGLLFSASALSASSPFIDSKKLLRPLPASEVASDSIYYRSHLRAKIAHSIAKGERRASERDAQRRSVCYRCDRPPALCVCDVLPQQRFPTFTQILILQHPNERRKKNFSTVPLLRLVLENVQVIHGYSFDCIDLIPPVKEWLRRGQKPLLLYPSPDAVSLDKIDSNKEELAFSRSGHDHTIPPLFAGANQSSTSSFQNRQNLLVIVDGTWTEAKRMTRDSPFLMDACQLVQFTSETDSIYNAVRKEPEQHCLSTLEACAQALELLEPETELARDYLQAALQSHVDSHLANGAIMAPRSAGAASAKLYAKNKRRREIELSLFTEGGREQERTKQEPGQHKEGSTTAAQSTNTIVRKLLPGGVTLRPLVPLDAPLVNSWWEYQSSKSLPLVSRLIALDQGVACCLGIEKDGSLIGCIMRYEGGALGMLHVEEAYRRRGYGITLLHEATLALQERGEERMAFVVDGNEPSEALFAAAGWERDNPTQKRGTGKRRAKRKWVHR